MNYIISEQQDGMLLRTYLRTVCRVSSRLLSRLKQTPGGITLHGELVTVRARLRANAVLSLAIEDQSSAASAMTTAPLTSVVPRALPLQILYEDGYILLCNKPADMPTHPSHGHFDDTLANAVAAYKLSRGRPAPVFRPITRLDRNTSGVVLIARTQLTASRLSEDMRLGNIRKTYYALLCGAMPEKQGEILTGIRRAQKSLILREVCDFDDQNAAVARTRYEVVASWQTEDGSVRSLVRATPLTGRTHQLRLHFAASCAPVLGDGLYGYGEVPDFCGHALHAKTLSFPHPVTGNVMKVDAPLPTGFLSAIPSEYQPLIE